MGNVTSERGDRSFIGVHHLALYVKDVPASADWYHRVLCFDSPELSRSIARLRHPGLDLILRPMTEQPGGEVAETGESRVFDHVALQVRDRTELERWSAWLEGLGEISAIDDAANGSSIELLDPDGNEVELFLPAVPA